MLCLVFLSLSRSPPSPPLQVERLDYVVPARAEEERQDDSDLPEAEVRDIV